QLPRERQDCRRTRRVRGPSAGRLGQPEYVQHPKHPLASDLDVPVGIHHRAQGRHQQQPLGAHRVLPVRHR
ncbi:unnamed protein product, partial [Ectocarpus sp. 12 AP-2014]